MYRAGFKGDGDAALGKLSWLILSEGNPRWMPFRSAPSQNRLCLLREVTVEKACPQSLHLICWRQSACILLWRQRLENWVYALRQTSHWKGLTLLWICWCCFSPLDVAKVFPHSPQAWLLAPTCWDLIWRCKLLGSVKILSQFSQLNFFSESWVIYKIHKHEITIT